MEDGGYPEYPAELVEYPIAQPLTWTTRNSILKYFEARGPIKDKIHILYKGTLFGTFTKS